MNVLPLAPPPPRADRPATLVVHDEPNVRVVGFHLQPGQRVPPHRSSSTVLVRVVSGSGLVRGEGDERLLHPGEQAVYAPGEVHAIEAGAEPLHFVAILTPSPSA